MSFFPHAFICTVALLAISVASDGQPKPSLSTSRDYSKDTSAQLIDDLTEINSFAPGLDSADIFDGFIAGDGPLSFKGGVLGVPPPTIPPQMRELVRRGPLVLDELVKHLDDQRPTGLRVGNMEADKAHGQVGVNVFMFSYFSLEYDPRSRDHSDSTARKQQDAGKALDGSYTVKVGDVCFVLIGQIVNRRLLAVRYQPSGGLIVNSPVELPALAEEVRRDWSGANAEALKSSLLADIRGNNRPSWVNEQSDLSFTILPALERLRFYFPDAYHALSGEDAKKKAVFEKGGSS
jgi:hypothetical protein